MSWSLTRNAGLRELIGSWKIIPMLVPRTIGIFHFGIDKRSDPWKTIRPWRMRAGGSGKSRGID